MVEVGVAIGVALKVRLELEARREAARMMPNGSRHHVRLRDQIEMRGSMSRLCLGFRQKLYTLVTSSLTSKQEIFK